VWDMGVRSVACGGGGQRGENEGNTSWGMSYGAENS
jgi:hypothetical protein